MTARWGAGPDECPWRAAGRRRHRSGGWGPRWVRGWPAAGGCGRLTSAGAELGGRCGHGGRRGAIGLAPQIGWSSPPGSHRGAIGPVPGGSAGSPAPGRPAGGIGPARRIGGSRPPGGDRGAIGPARQIGWSRPPGGQRGAIGPARRIGCVPAPGGQWGHRPGPADRLVPAPGRPAGGHRPGQPRRGAWGPGAIGLPGLVGRGRSAPRAGLAGRSVGRPGWGARLRPSRSGRACLEGDGRGARRRGSRPPAATLSPLREAARSSRSMRSSKAATLVSALGPGEADQRHLERHPGVDRVAHVGQRLADLLHGPHQSGRPEPAGLLLDLGRRASSGSMTRPRAMVARKPLRRWSRRSAASRRASRPGAMPSATASSTRPGVPLGQPVDDLGPPPSASSSYLAGGRHLVEHGEGVAGRTVASPHHQVDGLGRDAEAGPSLTSCSRSPSTSLASRWNSKCMGPAADGRQHLLGVGGGEHEHHVAGRFLQRLQQGAGGVGGQLVDLVDDVDLPAAPGAERDPGQQVPHLVQASVGGGVEFLDVHRRPAADVDAGRARAVGLAVRPGARSSAPWPGCVRSRSCRCPGAR